MAQATEMDVCNLGGRKVAGHGGFADLLTIRNHVLERIRAVKVAIWRIYNGVTINAGNTIGRLLANRLNAQLRPIHIHINR